MSRDRRHLRFRIFAAVEHVQKEDAEPGGKRAEYKTPLSPPRRPQAVNVNIPDDYFRRVFNALEHYIAYLKATQRDCTKRC